uniref:Uncharacterized protein n=1 Tax=Trichogramma kaykai TaxID=54128 RepID=A0ABD2X7X3_9HYME
MVKTDIEWELKQSYFNSIVNTFGYPKIDLFASADNRKCSNFISWKPHREALAIDAFTIRWESFFYAFPPFSLITKTLSKIKRDRAYGIIVVPLWRNQPWFPLLDKLTIGKPLIMGPDINMLLSPCRKLRHPSAKHLTLIACKVSGTRS